MIRLRYFVLFLMLISFDVKSQEKSTLFIDDFDDNMNHWIVDSTATVVAKIVDSKYVLNNKKEGDWWTTKRISIDLNKEFDIAVVIAPVRNQSDGFAGLVWGGQGQQFLEFSITSSGHFRIMEHTSSNQARAWKEKTSSPFIKQGIEQSNRLSVEKKNDDYHFFVNDSVVYRMPYQKVQGNGVGVFVSSLHGASFDNFRVQIKNFNEPDPPKDPRFLFQEYFTQNDNDWEISRESKIERGTYTITTHKDSVFYTDNDIYIDGNREFKIETIFRNIDYKETMGYGLSLGNDANSSDFLISPNGFFSVDRDYGKKIKTIKKWTKSSSIRIGVNSQNKITIHYKPPMYSFYVNDELVFMEKHFPGNIETVGFVVYGGQKISIDCLTISEQEVDDLTPKINALKKVPIQEKEFREQDHRFVELMSTSDQEVTDLDFGLLFQKEHDVEEDDADYLSWFILTDSLRHSSVLYSYSRDNFLVENKTSDDINLFTYLKEEPENYLIEMEYAITVSAFSSLHAFFLGDSENEEYQGLGVDKGFISVLHNIGETQTTLMDWKGFGSLRQDNGAMNKFSVMVLNGTCYYYINNYLIYQGKKMKSFDSLIFQISGKQKIELDYLRFYCLK
jgi:hypothetical protein